MTYDHRLRPQALWMEKSVFLVYKGGCPPNAGENVPAYPFVISFDLVSRTFSAPIRLSSKPSTDQHHCPIIWADTDGYLHVLHGCHKTPGTHLRCKVKRSIGMSAADWEVMPQVRSSASYPTVYNVSDNRQVVYLRTGEHRSSWSYRLTADNGRTWTSPPTDVEDLNMGGDNPIATREPMADERTSYHSCLPSPDGTALHVAFCWYDDNKQNLPEKFWNPRYKTKVNLGLKYNLYYVRIDLKTHEVKNFAGKTVKTPISFDTANADCLIWDTEWRGTGVPPDIMLDENNNPAFLHVLTEDSPDKLQYYYVRYVKDRWVQTPIVPSSHEWNSGHLRRDADGTLHAYLIAGKQPLDTGKDGFMDRHGGAGIEEWVSLDVGSTWTFTRDLTPDAAKYPDWKFNNVQPIKDSFGKPLEGAYLFYGWKDPKECSAQAFLIIQRGKEAHHGNQ